MTLAAGPRNHENAVKSKTWRYFSLPSTLQGSARRTATCRKSVVEGIYFSHSLGRLLAFSATPESAVFSFSGSSRTAIGREPRPEHAFLSVSTNRRKGRITDLWGSRREQPESGGNRAFAVTRYRLMSAQCGCPASPSDRHQRRAKNTSCEDQQDRSRRGGGWNWVGVISGLFNPNDFGVGALERRPRHDEGYHEGGGCGRRSFAFG